MSGGRHFKPQGTTVYVKLITITEWKSELCHSQEFESQKHNVSTSWYSFATLGLYFVVWHHNELDSHCIGKRCSSMTDVHCYEGANCDNNLHIMSEKSRENTLGQKTDSIYSKWRDLIYKSKWFTS